MLGLPSPSAVANQALAGIKFAADFKPDMGFKVVAEAQTMQTPTLKIERFYERESAF